MLVVQRGPRTTQPGPLSDGKRRGNAKWKRSWRKKLQPFDERRTPFVFNAPLLTLCKVTSLLGTRSFLFPGTRTLGALQTLMLLSLLFPGVLVSLRILFLLAYLSPSGVS